jgi:hypothetical protein
MEHSMPRLLAVVSDLHCGSVTGLLPPDFTTVEGNTIGLSEVQRFLWASWLDATQRWLPGVLGSDPWNLIVNGDVIEGVHHGTKQVISPDTKDHTAAAIAVLRPLVEKARRTYMIRGTECHTGNAEVTVGEALATAINRETGKPFWDRLTLDICGVRCVFRHHIGTSVRSYTSDTQLGIARSEEIVEAVKNGEPHPRVIGCAHRHKWGRAEDDESLCVVSPPWQMLTRFGHKVVSQSRTKPGIYVLDWRGLDDGELPRVHRILYRAPAPIPADL